MVGGYVALEGGERCAGVEGGEWGEVGGRCTGVEGEDAGSETRFSLRFITEWLCDFRPVT